MGLSSSSAEKMTTSRDSRAVRNTIRMLSPSTISEKLMVMSAVSIQVKLVARPAISSLNITRRAMTSVMAENAAATYFAYFCLSPPMNRVTMAPIRGRTMSRVSSDISISDSSQDLCNHNEEN